MSEQPNDPANEKVAEQSDVNEHADKYNDPRVKITRRGVLLGVGVVLFGIAGAAASVIGRKTQLEKSREFWGDDAITAFQLGERMQMQSVTGEKFEAVELTATPGLGHLRHTLLEQRSYDWDSLTKDDGMESIAAANPSYCVRLVFSDPTAQRFDKVSVDIDLLGGWIGPTNGNQRVKSRKQAALKKFLGTLITVQQRTYDLRNREESES